ncbi:chromosome segregation ATPase [Methylohalomonas lacus]|uniref:Chromosome segregation ATPase n=1 Tax=Methylohalomonas lacus TaxID=398773 RepID=A0AAE3HLE1_9GAMM|nr:hypothetical protein [Methylohalomonas lacus]MCS3903271.1 chromosome segregation ATPase [Methylohalomonas lacus]
MNNKRFKRSLATLLAAVLAAMLLGQPVTASIKCWTNDEGVRECGNSVPPEYAQQGHSELSEQGIVIDRKERAKTDEELAEQRRQAEIAAERERELQRQRRHDSILLQTFSSERDIITARDAKLSAMDGQIALAQSRIEKLREDLDKRETKAASAERSGRDPSADLLEDIASLRRQIRSNQTFIEETRADQDELREIYNKDLERFRELKAKE